VKKSNGTLYWYGPSGEVLAETDLAGNDLREYIYHNGRRIARRDAAGAVYYYFQDHLGSSRVITDDHGNIVQESDYYPFGGERVLTGGLSEKFKFGGMERDAESGLDHTLFRQYAWNLGRWLTPDPFGGHISNPQSLNRYGYVLNNSTNSTDPLGLDACVYTWMNGEWMGGGDLPPVLWSNHNVSSWAGINSFVGQARGVGGDAPRAAACAANSSGV